MTKVKAKKEVLFIDKGLSKVPFTIPSPALTPFEKEEVTLEGCMTIFLVQLVNAEDVSGIVLDALAFFVCKDVNLATVAVKEVPSVLYLYVANGLTIPLLPLTVIDGNT